MDSLRIFKRYWLDFEKDNPGITLEPWGLEEFRQVFRKLTPEDLQSWFGIVPSDATKSELASAICKL